MADWVWYVESRSVDHALDGLARVFTPEALSAFLGGPIGEYLAKQAENRFASEGDATVGKWAPLRPATVQIRIDTNFGGDHPINRRTGELEDWVVGSGWDAYPTGFGASLKFPAKEPTGVLRKKVEIAQVGGGEYNTVARPVLGLDENDVLYAISALSLEIEEAVG